jgi:uncharacterized protein
MVEPKGDNPWYREPWPWILMSGPLLAVVGSLASAALAVRGADPVVDENYYQHGLQINRELDRDRNARDLDLRSVLQVAGVRRGDAIRLRLSSLHVLTDTTVSVRLVHGGDAVSERSAVLGRLPNDPGAAFYGQWLQAPDDHLGLDGQWRVQIEGATWRLEGLAGAESHLVARTAGVRFP